MNFTDKVFEISRTTSIKNLRAAAFMVDKGFNMASSDGVPYFAPTFVGWMTDRKRDYTKAYPHMVLSKIITKVYPHMVLNDVITDHDHFTNFIVSGEWRK
ncbi:hypothetical protein XNMGNQLM_CDS0110 [Escherichia phage MIZ6]|uniref:Uncharacterized protein n=1 Tax=Escherichia phage kaaroe TaxID=2696412 RepID=A0A6B9WSK1_9CAUD|nr:hypothetical protein kaaroe_183 [Escherichia phage kaaroe]WMT11538.1 hypothetical protein XNMGNQLM_CDS0110 [Escherichia phage MIZ6]WNA14371.1 hypothetical protein SILIKYPJ_CDS0110 [Krischvirus RB49]WNA14639.1 hypothetical protein YCRUBIWT_CDS0110 [Krischvirus RB49]